jgi:hypothetical protein
MKAWLEFTLRVLHTNEYIRYPQNPIQNVGTRASRGKRIRTNHLDDFAMKSGRLGFQPEGRWLEERKERITSDKSEDAHSDRDE